MFSKPWVASRSKTHCWSHSKACLPMIGLQSSLCWFVFWRFYFPWWKHRLARHLHQPIKTELLHIKVSLYANVLVFFFLTWFKKNISVLQWNLFYFLQMNHVNKNILFIFSQQESEITMIWSHCCSPSIFCVFTRIQGNHIIPCWEIQGDWLRSYKARKPQRSCIGEGMDRGRIPPI